MFLILFGFSFLPLTGGIAACTLSRPLLGEFYSYENGLESHSSFKENGDIERRFYRRESGAGATRKDTGGLLVNEDIGECFRLTHKQFYYELIYRDKSQSCFQCYQMFNRTKNILQIRKSSCGETTSLVTNQMNFDELCRSIDEQSEFITLFLKTYTAEECRQTIYGTFHFTYEFREGGIGICDNPSSRLISCPDPGTPFEAVNERFRMRYGYCKYLTSSFDADQLNQCLGSWLTNDGNIITAIANERVGSERWYDKFRCMLTRQDQPQWFAKSLFAECSSLSSPTDGPEKVIITPIIPEEPTASCFFPSNLTGQWINTANVNARILINATHIHEIAKVNNRGWLRETYYVCQQTSRSQYLVKAVTKGECFSYYICFDFKDRHHNILRYRKSKSFMANLYKLFTNRDPFFEVCSWTSFGNDANWKYQIFVLDPPAPVECPFTGMWTFKQVGQPNSLIQTRIRGGVTPRPRDHGWYITCDPQYMVSQWTICGDQTKSMFADREYCRQLDPYGTPIGVYEQPDYIYQCAGYWREDSRSMMVTYDRDDPYINYKCWVYERRDLTRITLSRSAGSACGFNQTSESYKPEDGADLAVTLIEAERIHDDCPIRYDDGRNIVVMSLTRSLISLLFLILINRTVKSQLLCTFDRPLLGEYYSYENGLETHTALKDNGEIERLFYRRQSGLGATANIITILDNYVLGECFSINWRENPLEHASKQHYEVIYRDKEKSCYQCYQIYNRTRNILQIRKSECDETTSILTNQMNFQDLCGSINQEADFDTLFSKTYSAEECRATIYGTYHFTYEFREGGIGICDNPISRLVSCPDPGTPFDAVNERFWMTYGYCRDLVSSIDAQPLYQCLGYWINEKGDIFTGIANERVGSERWYDKFRCMLTRQDQPQWFAKSLFAECARLYSPTDGPEKVIITPIIPEVPTPTCFFPDNFTGEWVNTANVNARTIINATHIHEISQVNNRGWLRETYYVCQQISRQQFLVKTVTKGECFSYYICFDFKDRHHNILRYRKSKSFMSNVYDDLSKRDPLYEVCSWTSFGNDANWKYQVFVLDPPSPVECPFTGMWTFKQVGQPNSLIQTRVRGGITPRPRDHGWYITCDPQYMVSQWTICGDQTKSMLADREYCRQLDPYGTPIGVYEQPDYIYQCAGYWREDSRSYLITYDRDDPYINFKCWVYERLDLFKIYISRSAGSFCGFNQTSESYKPEDGADLRIELDEAERIHDDCPIRYDDGRNPWQVIDEFLFYYASARTNLPSFFLYVFLVPLILNFY